MSYMNAAAFDASQYITQTEGRVEIRCPDPERSLLSYIAYPEAALKDAGDELAKSLKELVKKKIVPAAFTESIFHAQRTLKGE